MSNPTMDEVWSAHHDFEIIHPLIDGNGRTGRLLLNWLSLKHLGQFMIVEAKHRGDYYKTIEGHSPKFKEENPGFT